MEDQNGHLEVLPIGGGAGGAAAFGYGLVEFEKNLAFNLVKFIYQSVLCILILF